MDLSITFVGNATTLLSYGEITLLTDPNFLHRGQHAYLGYGLLSKRLREPALTIDELPPIDAVVLSHMHGDHWDRTAQRDLDHALRILTTPHAAERLRRRGFTRRRGCVPGTGTESPEVGTRCASRRCPAVTRRPGAGACCRR